ncbi:hypothetical protein [Pseudomonas brassicacearum]|uniref:hypothetical protein n=1 Tax=Pseudomonas brassicacearum TaxID=930166 RepID=UPI000F46D004|nr:hypothetical protein [Pseudomonas brassicacearum]
MNINSVKRCTLIGAILIATCLALPANADRHGGGHIGAPFWWGIGLGLGLGWEGAYLRGPYYYPSYPVYYYPPPVYYYPANPPVVAAPPNTQPAPSWYYCPSAKGYYPYVHQCPEAWRLVPGTPSGPIH